MRVLEDDSQSVDLATDSEVFSTGIPLLLRNEIFWHLTRIQRVFITVKFNLKWASQATTRKYIARGTAKQKDQSLNHFCHVFHKFHALEGLLQLKNLRLTIVSQLLICFPMLAI